MKKIIIYTFLLILLSLYSITVRPASEMQKQKVSAQFKTELRPAPRAPPADTIHCSVQISGPSNLVIFNGKRLETSPDTIDTKNHIRVNGLGNTVSIIQNGQQSEVTISQQGENNQIHISQTK